MEHLANIGKEQWTLHIVFGEYQTIPHLLRFRKHKWLVEIRKADIVVPEA